MNYSGAIALWPNEYDQIEECEGGREGGVRGAEICRRRARRVKGKFGLFRNRMSAHLLIIIDFGFLKTVNSTE